MTPCPDCPQIPAGPSSRCYGDSLNEGCLLYLASRLAANTKYSVNRRLFQPDAVPFRSSKTRKSLCARQPRKRADRDRNAWKSGKKTGLRTFRPRPQQERMAHKKRLGTHRQRFVSCRYDDATCCGEGVWIAGTRRAVEQSFRHPAGRDARCGTSARRRRPSP